MACVTPFLDSGAIDYSSLSRVLRMGESASGGILLLGSTGEGLSLSFPERLRIVQYTCEQELSVPIFVGVSGIDILGAEIFIQKCNRLPIQGYLLTTPIYSKPGVFGQLSWFRRLMHQTTLPVILYNIPSRSGVSIYPEVIRTLQIEPNFYGIKDASGRPSFYSEFLTGPSACTLFCGDDILVEDFLKIGAKGWINVAGNVWPEIVSKYYNYLRQNFIDIRMDDFPWREACSLLSSGGNPVSVKAVLEKLGVIASATVREPLNVADFVRYKDIESVHQKLTNWSVFLDAACTT
ncbi:4-hydroxy-tetrahydrodipicolinate synthase [Chlamydiifrater phoenicopteri]|uniref:4-hydroxy-tetrahydrodipicolinate synthase n=1 Tax=Chlamydiifrater phoenicopteri TaxID=2681469 RepID=UPI001BCFD2AB|nr:4-hydroxy-tetrahydrodipicolinate synthase [Chlamydiifrater phoenicopteri]